ncbi:MAG: hypothetical protein ABR512_08820 [Desulfopila sp.]
MLSSTSNSNGRAAKYLGDRHWSRCMLLTACMYLILLGGWEVIWRYQGFSPSITDDWPIWSHIRRQANGDADDVALVGASRILLGLDPRILQKKVGGSVHMLAIDGSNPLPVLADLGNDPDFKGTVICSIAPLWLAAEVDSSGDRTAKWLRKYATQPLSSRLETSFALQIQAHLVFRYGGLAPQKLWHKWRQGRPVEPPYAPMRADRYRRADYSLADLQSLRASRVERTRELHDEAVMLQPQDFLQRVEDIEHSVDQIQQRGGAVVFVRFPSCGAVLRIEEETVPRQRYWDVFAAEISASTLHFADYDELDTFDCMDGSHLNYDDAARFTRNLADLFGEKEIIKD